MAIKRKVTDAEVKRNVLCSLRALIKILSSSKVIVNRATATEELNFVDIISVTEIQTLRRVTGRRLVIEIETSTRKRKA